MRRIVDIVFAALMLVVTMPILLVACLSLLLSARVNPIFPARRIGQGGGIFVMYKLRTMKQRRTYGARITAPADHRISAAGRFWRRTNIDEFPQFWNVLIGDMTLVGPRPEALGLLDTVPTSLRDEWLSLKPGLTSTGTLFAKRWEDRLDPADPEGSYLRNVIIARMEMDVAHARSRTVLKDLSVCIATIALIADRALRKSDRQARKSDNRLVRPT